VTTGDIAALIDAGKFTQALARCERVLASDPANVSALINQGIAQLGLGAAAKARRAFNRVINEDPTVAGAWDGLGKGRCHVNHEKCRMGWKWPAMLAG
jgi:predicted Zn-dependent protease